MDTQPKAITGAGERPTTLLKRAFIGANPLQHRSRPAKRGAAFENRRTDEKQPYQTSYESFLETAIDGDSARERR
jgi:hypothetical protein